MIQGDVDLRLEFLQTAVAGRSRSENPGPATPGPGPRTADRHSPPPSGAGGYRAITQGQNGKAQGEKQEGPSAVPASILSGCSWLLPPLWGGGGQLRPTWPPPAGRERPGPPPAPPPAWAWRRGRGGTSGAPGISARAAGTGFTISRLSYSPPSTLPRQ